MKNLNLFTQPGISEEIQMQLCTCSTVNCTCSPNLFDYPNPNCLIHSLNSVSEFCLIHASEDRIFYPPENEGVDSDGE